MHEISNPVFWGKKKNILKCRLLNIYPATMRQTNLFIVCYRCIYELRNGNISTNIKQYSLMVVNKI